MRHTIAFLLGLLMIAASPASAQDPIDPKWALTEGSTFYVRSKLLMELEMTVMNQDVTVTMESSGIQRFKLVSVRDGKTKVEFTFMELKSVVKAGAAPGLGQGADAIGERIRGVKLTATLDDKLQLLELEGHDELMGKLAAGDENLKKALGASMNKDAVSLMISSVFEGMPGKPVKPGDTWTQSTKMAANGYIQQASVKKTYTYKDVSEGVARFNLTAAMELKAGAGAVPGLPPGIKVSKFEMKPESMSGQIRFDVVKGRLVESKQTATLSGKFTLEANGQDIEMKMKLKTTASLTVIDKNPLTD